MQIYHFQQEMFPYLLVTIGSGCSILKVNYFQSLHISNYNRAILFMNTCKLTIGKSILSCTSLHRLNRTRSLRESAAQRLAAEHSGVSASCSLQQRYRLLLFVQKYLNSTSIHRVFTYFC